MPPEIDEDTANGSNRPPSGIFDAVFFTFNPSPDLPSEERLEVQGILEHEGATHVPFDTSLNRIRDLKAVTHIISKTSDFPQYDEALDLYIHVVKPIWVRHSKLKGKESNPRQYSPDRNLIMSDVTICCADVPEGDKEAIAGGVLAMGGLYTANLTKMVTHLIALNIEDPRCQAVIQKNLRCKIVLPHWFDDCLRLGSRIPETPYLLPNAEILRKQERPPAQRVSADVEGATSPHPTNTLPTPAATADGSRKLDVFTGKQVMLSGDLNLGKNLLRTLTELVNSGGGLVVDDVDEAEMFICQYRDGEDYVRASQLGKEVGNLAWLCDLITHNRWTSPFRRMLTYPVPRKPIKDMQDAIISVSNYSGDARIYLENLVKACGASFTKTLHQKTTHLITAHKRSEKCDAALDWNIHVVNHLWLEDTYARQQMQSVSLSRYTHFPERTNLGAVIGQTQLQRAIIEKEFFPKATKSKSKAISSGRNAPLHEVEAGEGDVTIPPGARRARRSNVKTDETPSRAMSAGGKENETPGSKSAKSRNISRLQTSTSADTPTNKSTEVDVTPGTRGSRAAAIKANSTLHTQAEDIAKYEKEKKRVGGVTHGRDRRSAGEEKVTETKVESRGKKRHSNEMDAEDETVDEDEEAAATSPIAPKSSKRQKAEPKPAVTYKMVLTGYTRWVSENKLEAKEKTDLRNLGVHIIEDPSKCNMLCAPSILKTKKFVCALANAPLVVSTAFLDYCIKNKKLPDPKKYALYDRQSEERLGFKLSRSLRLAEQYNHKLLDTWQIFVTEDIAGGFETFKSIIDINGGACMRYTGRVTAQVKKRAGAAETQEGEEKESLYLVSGVSQKEKALWPKFRQLAEKADMIPVIAKSDWLLSVTMRMEFHWDDQWALAD